MPSKHKRPFGLHAIVIIQLLRALLFSILIGLVYHTDLRLSAPYQADASLEWYLPLTYILSMAGVVLAYGLWQRRNWAWVGLMVQLVLIMLLDLLAYTSTTPNYPMMALNVLQAFYVAQGDVRQAFQPVPAFSSLRKRMIPKHPAQMEPPAHE